MDHFTIEEMLTMQKELQEKYNAFKAEKEHLNSMINRILSYTPDELDNMLIENEKRGIE